ncbi:SDR family NAD(P)-dependent oxidoreductase [Streptomyces sp. NPDC051740]|uniref:SDR family NAD(P)-dependent oxidoreductase n=1 Tax=Streptomyces sp. NPDC051740 TaxID=3365673 RepID=UPI0037B5150B
MTSGPDRPKGSHAVTVDHRQAPHLVCGRRALDLLRAVVGVDGDGLAPGRFPAGRPVGDSHAGHPADRTGTRSLALITGASGGIGHEPPRQSAEHCYDLVVNAEGERLEPAVRRLRETDARVRPVRAGLRTREGAGGLLAAVGGLTVDLAALDAGGGRGGAFVDTDPAGDQAVIDPDITATVRPAKPLLCAMVTCGGGRIASTSSVASTVPGPFQPVRDAPTSPP